MDTPIKKSQTVTEMRADLYNEVLKWYRVDNEQVIKLRHAITQVNNALDAVTAVSYTHLTLPTNREV